VVALRNRECDMNKSSQGTFVVLSLAIQQKEDVSALEKISKSCEIARLEL
jgi:hypothetical protein